jgi:hypothetical protein
MAAGHIEGAAEGIVEEGLAVGMEAAEEEGIELAAGIDLVLLDNTRPPRLHAVVDCTPSYCRPERVASDDHPKYICCN